MYGKRERLENLAAYKLRPAPNSLPGKWMTGTQNHEGILGMREAIITSPIWRENVRKRPRRKALMQAYQHIRAYEEALCKKLLAGLAKFPQLRIWGITELGSAGGTGADGLRHT